MPQLTIQGRTIQVTPQQYAAAMAKRRELAQKDRQVSRDLRTEHLLPAGSYSKHAKAAQSGSFSQDRTERDNLISWKADKANRMKKDFESFEVRRSSSLDWMHKAFDKLA